jgi:nicotinate-nucleotide adenylyltransferase
MTARRRIGVFGGTFDPIHRGHIDIACAAEAALDLARLFVIPASVPPHRPQPLASSFHRFAMVALSMLERPRWRASDLELRSGGRSYTSATLEQFHARGYSPQELFFVIGADAFVEIGTWKDYPGILEMAHFAVVSRPGCQVTQLPARHPLLEPRMVQPPFAGSSEGQPSIILIDAPTADVSATTIRDRRNRGQPITGMVDPAVEQHIEQHGLYTSIVPGRRGSDQQPSPAAGRLHGQG